MFNPFAKKDQTKKLVYTFLESISVLLLSKPQQRPLRKTPSGQDNRFCGLGRDLNIPVGSGQLPGQ